MVANADYIASWQSKGLSAESIKLPTTSNNGLTPAMSYYGTKTRVKFAGSCLKQSKISYTHKTIVKNSLLGAVTLTKKLILISIGILVMELVLIVKVVFHFQAVDLVKM